MTQANRGKRQGRTTDTRLNVIGTKQYNITFVNILSLGHFEFALVEFISLSSFMRANSFVTKV